MGDDKASSVGEATNKGIGVQQYNADGPSCKNR